MMSCRAPGCARYLSPDDARGLCTACYQRARRRGILDTFPRVRWGRGAYPSRKEYWRAYYKERKARIAREIANGR